MTFTQAIGNISSAIVQSTLGSADSELPTLIPEGSGGSKLPSSTTPDSSNQNLSQQFQQQSQPVSAPQSPGAQKQLFSPPQQQQQQQQQSLSSRLPPLSIGSNADQHLQQHFQQPQTQLESEPPSPFQRQHQSSLSSPTLHSPPPISESGTLPTNQHSDATSQQSDKQLQQSELQRQQQLLLQQVAASNLFRQAPGGFY